MYLYLVNVYDIDEEGSNDMHAVYPKWKQHALDDATNSAFNHHDTSRTSNAAGIVHVSKRHILLIPFRTSSR